MSLVAVRDPQMPRVLQELVTSREVSSAAIRGLAAYDDGRTPQTLIDAYPLLTDVARRDALNTLASRAAWSKNLLEAIAAGTVPRIDLTADLVRQIGNLKDASLDEMLKQVWGVVRDSPTDKLKQIVEYKSGSRPAAATARSFTRARGFQENLRAVP